MSGFEKEIPDFLLNICCTISKFCARYINKICSVMLNSGLEFGWWLHFSVCQRESCQRSRLRSAYLQSGFSSN